MNQKGVAYFLVFCYFEPFPFFDPSGSVFGSVIPPLSTLGSKTPPPEVEPELFPCASPSSSPVGVLIAFSFDPQVGTTAVSSTTGRISSF